MGGDWTARRLGAAHNAGHAAHSTGHHPTERVTLAIEVDLLTVLRAEAAAAGVPLSAYVNRKLRDNRLSAGYHASARWLAETDPGWDAFVEAATAEAWAKDCR